MSPVRRRRARSAKSEAKRLAILAAAARAIAEYGFHGMSMRDLARATGQALAGFYNYFRSKEEVLFHIQAGAFETLIVEAEDALRGLESPQDRLFAFLYQHVRYFVEHPDVMRVLVHEAGALPRQQRDAVRTLKERYYAVGRGIVEEIARRGCSAPGTGGEPPDAVELERITYGIFGLLNWVYAWYEPARHGSPGEVASSLHRLALCGLVARCPQRAPDGQRAVERRLSLVTPRPLLGGAH
jgi:AcrR family transcriptional regulator